MNSCQEVETKISSLVDIQLKGEEILETVDHIVECSACRDFYQKARLLDKRLGEVRAHNPEKLMSPALWNRIRRASGFPKPKLSLASPTFLWSSVLAAAVLVASLGLWTLKAFDRAALELPDTIDVVLEGQPTSMTDARFVLMAKELLEADRKYHYKMMEIMQQFVMPRGESRTREGRRTREHMMPDGGEQPTPQLTEMS